MSVDNILEVKDLRISFRSGQQSVVAVENMHFCLGRGKTVGIVGESGSGKSVTALSIMGLLTSGAKIESGKILFQPSDTDGTDLLALKEKELQLIRGAQIGMIFQEPMTSLNPVHTCGEQVAEAIRLHHSLPKKEAKERVLSLFEEVDLPRIQEIYKSYPHEISGGQKQRVMIAMAISCQPSILIADEPTTALDVTVQKRIIELLRRLQDQHQMSILFITHDLGVVAEIADDVLVMRKGQRQEFAPIEEIFSTPKASYTKGLLACRPPLTQRISRLPTIQDFEQSDHQQKNIQISITEEAYQQRLTQLQSQSPILQVDQLSTWFSQRKSLWTRAGEPIKAVNNVSFEMYPGETLGLVGESGCGKTTLGRSILRLIEPTYGTVRFQGKSLQDLNSSELRASRKKLQIIFQDPYSSLNPRMSIGQAIEEPMKVHAIGSSASERKDQVAELLEKVGLKAEHALRYPHEFSGGQRQRVCIARTLAVNPQFIICDESVSALDVSVQAQVLNLLRSLQEEFQFTYLFISHDLSVVKFMSDRILVMKSGEIVEQGDAESVFHQAQSPYTQQLISAIPTGSVERIRELQTRKAQKNSSKE